MTAFAGVELERSMSDLLVENQLASELDDDWIVWKTAHPSPCPLKCHQVVTLDGECRHGFVLTPVEQLG